MNHHAFIAKERRERLANARRAFKELLLSGSVFTILPGSGRVWKARDEDRVLVGPDKYIWSEFCRLTNRHMAECSARIMRKLSQPFVLGFTPVYDSGGNWVDVVTRGLEDVISDFAKIRSSPQRMENARRIFL